MNRDEQYYDHFQKRTDDEILDLLVKIGLTINQAKIYFELVKRHESPASKLCEVSQIKDSKIYGILNRLEQLGLIIVRSTVPKLYRVLPLDEGLENIHHQIEQDYFEKNDVIKQLKLLLTPVFDSISPVSEIAIVIRDERIIINSILGKLAAATKQVVAVVPGLESFQKLENSLRGLYEEGVELVVGIHGGISTGKQAAYPFDILPMSCDVYFVIIDDQYLYNISNWDEPESCYAILTSDSNLIAMSKSYIDNPTCRL
ncbi:MAG: TrmB family transcriptional regulator [Candidatus Odinarchaeota archaeon]